MRDKKKSTVHMA